LRAQADLFLQRLPVRMGQQLFKKSLFVIWSMVTSVVFLAGAMARSDCCEMYVVYCML
jgi:hypothetical protein